MKPARTKATTVRLWVIGPFLFYFFVFLLWFPRWQHAANAPLTRALDYFFGGMTAVLVAVYIFGAIVIGSRRFGLGWPIGESGAIGLLIDIAAAVYETYFQKKPHDKNIT